jgi:RNA polymerase sigma-70 factor (ECF subfamily)
MRDSQDNRHPTRRRINDSSRMNKPEPSWEDWYARHGPALLLLARQIVAAPADAEDALHDGFVSFWKKRSDVLDPAAYLFTCVRSAALDRRKIVHRRWRREVNEMNDVAGAPMFRLPAEQREQEALVRHALEQLPQDQREAIVMKLWGGLQFDQIGQAIGISVNTAASRYRYGLEKLRALLSEEVVR